MRRLTAVALLPAVFAVSLYTAAAAGADGNGNDLSTQQLCHNADYADLHPTLCAGPFGFGGGRGGAGGGVLGGLPIVGPILKGLGL